MPGSDRILQMLRRGSISSLCALLLWFGGCAKRQEPKSIVVYVPAHPPAAAPPAEKSEVLVIEEPAPPPAPEEATPSPTSQPPPHRRQGGPARIKAATEPDETSTQETPEPEPPPAEVPALEPRESSAQEKELRAQFSRLEEDIRQRLARLDGQRLSANDRKTLEDARTFFEQSTQAMTSGDIPRALNLARKASLLLAALE